MGIAIWSPPKEDFTLHRPVVALPLRVRDHWLRRCDASMDLPEVFIQLRQVILWIAVIPNQFTERKRGSLRADEFDQNVVDNLNMLSYDLIELLHLPVGIVVTARSPQ